MGPPDSSRVSRVPLYLGYLWVCLTFRIRAYHSLWRNFPDPSAMSYSTLLRSRNPMMQAPWFRLFRVRSPLLTESRLFSTPQVTEMFHFTWYCSRSPIDSGSSVPTLLGTGFPIRRSPDQSVPAAPRSLSQLTTSFIAY